jgi:integrase
VKACEDHRHGALFYLTLPLGLRLGEVLGLKWEDMDLEKRTVFVRRALQRVKGENVKTTAELVEPKTEHSYGLLSVPTTAISLRRHRLRQNEERLLAGSLWRKSGMQIGTATDPALTLKYPTTSST